MKGLLWVFFEKVGLTAISLVATFWYASILGPNGFGTSVVFLSFSMLISAIQDGPQKNPLLATTLDYKYIALISFKGWMILSFFISILLYIFMYFKWGAEYWLLILLSILHIPVSAMSRMFIADLIIKQKYKNLALRSVLGKALGVGLGLILAILGYAQYSIVVQSLTALCVSLIVMWRSSNLLYKSDMKWSFDKTERLLFLDLVKEGLPSAVNSINYSIRGHGFIVLLSFLVGNSAAGIFSLSMKLIDLPRTMIGFGFTSWATGKFKSIFSDKLKLKDTYLVALSALMLIMVPSYVGVIALSDVLVHTFFGREWSPVIEVTNWLAIYYLIMTTFLYLPILMILDKTTHKMVPFTLTSLVVLIVSVALLAPHFGVMGPVISLYISSMIIFPKQIRELVKTSGVRFTEMMKITLSYVFSALVMYFAVSFAKDEVAILYPYSLVLIGVFVYILCMFVMFISGVAKYEMIDKLIKM